MTAEQTQRMFLGVDEAIRDALIERFALSADAIERIGDIARDAGIEFAEAAVRDGVVTAVDVADVLQSMDAQASPEQPEIIETALRKMSSSRSLALPRKGHATAGAQITLAHDSDNPRGEQMRALRTQLLLLSAQSRKATSLALLSACAGEGRSLLAAELAVAFSQLGKSTLLVDADLRRPTQHLLFNANTAFGLARMLAFGESAELFSVERLPYLTLLLAGPLVPNPSELLSGERAEQLMYDWSRRYEFVIIDTPPLSKYADGLMLATLAGQVVMISRANKTPRRDIREILRRLEGTRSSIIGAIINSF
jgi:capsular exopolysaccharide synthesis family protein